MSFLFRFFYNIGLFVLSLAYAPKCLFDYVFYKKYRQNLPSKLGFFQLKRKNTSKKVIWIHAASLGEAKVALSFSQRLKKKYPQYNLFFSCVTETGFHELKKHLGIDDELFFMPLDFSFLMKNLVKQINPQLLILVESEFWPNLFFELKKNQTAIALINGKISQKSFNRFLKLPFLKKYFFDPIDLFCLQNTLYETRFQDLKVHPSKMHITGNIKFDDFQNSFDEKSLLNFKHRLHLTEQDKIITLASTHPKEEELLFNSLKHLMKPEKHLKVIVVPRHPERSFEVENLLKRKNLSYVKYSHCPSQAKTSQVILIDTIGLLNHCYQLSTVAIIGGSFVKIGGHNLIEPIQQGIPTFYGPHIFNQLELAQILKTHNLGFKTALKDLPSAIENFLHNPLLLKEYKKQSLSLIQAFQGSSLRTLDKIEKMLNTSC